MIYRDRQPGLFWLSMTAGATILAGFLLIAASDLHARYACPRPELSQHFWRCD